MKDKLGLTKENISSFRPGEYSGINFKLSYLSYLPSKRENFRISREIIRFKEEKVNLFKFRKLETASIWFTMKNNKFSLIKESFTYYPLFKLHEIAKFCNNFELDCESMYQFFHSAYLKYTRSNIDLVWKNTLEFISHYLRESKIFRVLIDTLHYEILAKENDPNVALIDKYSNIDINYIHTRVPTPHVWTDTIASSNHFYDIREIVHKLRKKSIKFVKCMKWDESLNYIPEPKCYIDSMLKIGDVRYILNAEGSEIVICIYIHQIINDNQPQIAQHIQHQPPTKIIKTEKLDARSESLNHNQNVPAWDVEFISIIFYRLP